MRNLIGRLLISLFFYPALSIGQVRPNIIGGQNGNISQVPWQAVIYVNGNFACGGVIIAPQWILTCAHCTFDEQTLTQNPVSDFTIYAGITQRSNLGAGQMGTVDEIILFPNYNYVSAITTNDIALMHLTTPFTFNSNVNQIAVATQNDVNAGYANPGTVAQISGWGVDGSGSPSNNLQILSQTIIANSTLNQSLYPYPITDEDIASGGVNGQGACGGDSGDPLTVLGANNKRILVGLHEFHASAGCAVGQPDINVRVSSYSNFLAQYTSTVSGTQPCCEDFSTTYTLNALVPVSNVTWTTSSDFTPSSGTGVSATLASANSISTSGTITYSFTTPQGGNINAVIPINNGQAVYANFTNDGQNELGTVNSVSPGQYNVFVVTANTPSYSWVLSSGSISWAPNGNGSSMTFNINSGQSGTWSVTANNRCSPYRDLTFTTQFNGYGFDIIQQQKNLIITVRPPAGVSANSSYSFNVQLYSALGNKVSELLSNQNKATFNISNIQKGKYKVVISKNTAQVAVPITIN